MTDAATADHWRDVDAYFADRLFVADEALAAALAANARAGLPAIDVSPAQGKLLHLLAQLMGAQRILEVGTLGGYSTIWLARALPADGSLVTLEIDPRHAEVARRNLERAGVGDRVDVRVGPAIESLRAIADENPPPFDLVFIDADKESNADYLAWALRLSRPGALVMVDNVVRKGAVADASDDSALVAGVRRAIDFVAAEPRLDATAIQTVGVKGWDGFLAAIVRS